MVDGELWRALQDPIEPEVVLPRPVVERRDVVLRWDGEVLRLRATWRLRAWEEAWFSQPLTGPGVRVERIRLDGRPIPLAAEDGSTRVTGRIDGVSELVVEGTVDGNPTERPLSLPLLQALSGTVRVQAPEGLEGRVTGDGVTVEGVTWSGAPRLQVQIGPPVRKAGDRRTLASASTGIGLTVSDGAVEGRARVSWALRQGRLSRVSLQVSGVGSDLSVTGSNVARFNRSGDRVVVELREAEQALVELDLRWSVPVPDGEVGELPLPRIVPQDAFRTEATLQIARDGELEILPELTAWTPVAAADLPTWGEGLVAGTPTAAYSAGSAGRPGSLGLLRYVPLAGPAVVVDVAALTVASSVEGRTLTRALYTVRNERAAHLRVRPPSDTLIVGARVQDGPVTPVADGDAWLIPLPRSLETVDGMLSFPVEVVLLGDGLPWARKEARQLPLPVVDAPVAVNRVTLHLPPTFLPELEAGQHGLVDDFTEGEGIAYGFGLGGEREAEADQKWQDAMSAWMRNDFDEADQILDELEGMGATNENLGRLRSNLDVVQGRGDDETVSSRRIVEQAKSRALDDYREQERILKEAEQEYASGDYGGSSAKYKKAAELSKKLDKLEQKESVEQKRKNEEANRWAEQARQEAERQQTLAFEPPPPDDAAIDQGQIRVGASRADQLTQLLDLEAPSVIEEVAGAKGEGPSSYAAPELAGPGFFDDDFDNAADVGEIFGHELVDGDEEIGGVEGGVLGGVVGGVAGHGAVGDGVSGGTVQAGEVRAAPDRVQNAPRRVIKTLERRDSGRSRRARDRDGRSGADDDVVEATSSSVTVARSRRGVGALRGGGGRGRRADRSDAPPPPPAPPAAPEPEPVVQFGRDVPEEVEDDDAGLRYAPRTEIDFDEVEVSGELAKPSASLLLDDNKDAPVDIAATQGSLEALEVTSTRLSVVVPVLGETLRYQHLLLPAGAEHSVHIEARGDRTVPRRPE